MNSRAGDGTRALKRMRAGLNVSVPDFADLIGCSSNHVWKLIREGRIRAATVDGVTSIPANEAVSRSGAEPIAA
jgi:hypothetical protein